jgi:hypothetical protein
VFLTFAMLGAGCASEADDPSSTREEQLEAETSSPDTGVELTRTEYEMVGTWEIVATDNPDRISVGERVGDVCSFHADFKLSCTIEGSVSNGFWRASDPIEHGDLFLGAQLTWVFEVSGYSSGSTVISLDEDNLVAGGTHTTTWSLVERLPRKEPTGEWADDATRQLLGTWSLVEGDEGSLLANLAATGDKCTFTPDHRVSCEGTSETTGLWRTVREWPDESSYRGRPLTILLAESTGIGGPYEIRGDKLTWDVVDAVFERVE